jgi:hypothetical protein
MKRGGITVGMASGVLGEVINYFYNPSDKNCPLPPFYSLSHS